MKDEIVGAVLKVMADIGVAFGNIAIGALESWSKDFSNDTQIAAISQLDVSHWPSGKRPSCDFWRPAHPKMAAKSKRSRR